MDSIFNGQNICLAAKKRKPKILIVDDEDYNILALKIILKYHIKLDATKLCDEAVNG